MIDLRGFAGAAVARALVVQSAEMAQVAVAWELYDTTKDPLVLGLLGLVQFLPVLLFAVVAGQVADRYPRKAVTLGALVFVVGAVGALLIVPRGVGVVLALMFVVGCLRAFLGPALGALLSSLIPPERIGRYAAVNSMLFTIATILGPALGGLLLATSSAEGVYGGAIVVLVVAGGMLTAVRAPPEPASSTPVSLSAAFDGLRFVVGRPMLFAALGLDFVAVFLGGVTALLPIYAVDVLHVGPTGLGVLRAAPAAGAAIMGLWLSVRPLEKGAGVSLFVCVAVFGVAIIAFGLSESFPLSLAMLAVLGAADMVSVVVRSALLQSLVPSAWRGRVNAVNAVFIGASNELGELESGIAAKLLGPEAAIVVGGVGTVAVVVVGFVWFRDLRRLDGLSALPTAAADGSRAA